MIEPGDRTRNGWTLREYNGFRDQLTALLEEVEALRRTLSDSEFEIHPKVRLAARIRKIVLEDIPRDPASPQFEQGNTLGPRHRHWRRAKFNQRYRLFFRFRSDVRIIVFAWLNDESTLRARGAKNDAYSVFSSRLRSGDPPDSWDDLLAQS